MERPCELPVNLICCYPPDGELQTEPAAYLSSNTAARATFPLARADCQNLQFATDWFGKPGCESWRGSIHITSHCQTAIHPADRLFFSLLKLPSPDSAPESTLAKSSVGAEQLSSEETFVEGLWEKEVFELFLCSPCQQFYWELHLSPLGEWWACKFGAPRIRASEPQQPLPGTKLHRAVTGKTSVLSLSVSLQQLEFDSLEGLRGNFTAVLSKRGVDSQNSIDVNEKRTKQYFSWAAPLAGSPDFHRFELFLPVVLYSVP